MTKTKKELGASPKGDRAATRVPSAKKRTPSGRSDPLRGYGAGDFVHCKHYYHGEELVGYYIEPWPDRPDYHYVTTKYGTTGVTQITLATKSERVAYEVANAKMKLPEKAALLRSARYEVARLRDDVADLRDFIKRNDAATGIAGDTPQPKARSKAVKPGPKGSPKPKK